MEENENVIATPDSLTPAVAKTDVEEMAEVIDERMAANYGYPYFGHDGGWNEGSAADLLMDSIIATMCSAHPCEEFKKMGRNEQLYTVEFLADNLPAVQFVSQFYLELIIHGGIIAKDDSNQKKLDKWMEQRNPFGQTNGNVIREALLNSIIYGYSGLRKVYSDLVFVAPSHFTIWKLPYLHNGKPVPGLVVPLLYEVSNNKVSPVDRKKGRVFTVGGKEYTLAEVVKENMLKQAPDGSYYLPDGQDGATVTQVMLLPENFCHLRHSDTGDYGQSPLTTDRLRTTLIIDYLRNVIDEIGNDGTDYMMYLRQRGTAGSSLTSSFNTKSTDGKIEAATDAKQVKTAREKQMEAARVLAKKLKRTQKTRIGIVDKNWVEQIEKLDGTVKLSDYKSIMDDAKGVVADIYGIPAMLAGSSGGGWSTGMSALIPFTLERTIKPFQQRYAAQLSQIICACAGINGPIKFKELNWEDEKTKAEIEKIKAETEKALAEAGKAGSEGKKADKETKLLTKEGVNGGGNQNAQNGGSPNKTSTSKKSTTKK